MTFVEVVIALVLAAIASMGMYASAIYTMRQTHKSVDQIFAVQLASSAAARVRAARYDKLIVDPATLGNSEFEKQFATAYTASADPLNNKSTTFTLTYKMSGYGKGATVTSSANPVEIDMSIPVGSAPWTANIYKDHFIVVTAGAGANQVMYILSNEPSRIENGVTKVKMKLTQNFDGTGSVGWLINPTATSVFAVDFGLYCNIEVTWGEGANAKSVKETVFVSLT